MKKANLEKIESLEETESLSELLRQFVEELANFLLVNYSITLKCNLKRKKNLKITKRGKLFFR